MRGEGVGVRVGVGESEGEEEGEGESVEQGPSFATSTHGTSIPFLIFTLAIHHKVLDPT